MSNKEIRLTLKIDDKSGLASIKKVSAAAKKLETTAKVSAAGAGMVTTALAGSAAATTSLGVAAVYSTKQLDKVNTAIKEVTHSNSKQNLAALKSMHAHKEVSASVRKQSEAFFDNQKVIKKGASVMSRYGKSALGSIATLTAGFLLLKKHVIDVGDRLDKLTKNLNVNTTTLQGLEYAAEQSGMSIGEFDKSLVTMNRRIGFAARGTGAAHKALLALNVDFDNLAEMTADEQLMYIADKLNDVGNESERAGYMFEIFGLAGTKMNAMLKDGTDVIEELIGKKVSMGVMDAKLIKQAAAVTDALNDTKNLVMGLVYKVSPPFVTAVDGASATVDLLTRALNKLPLRKTIIVEVLTKEEKVLVKKRAKTLSSMEHVRIPGTATVGRKRASFGEELMGKAPAGPPPEQLPDATPKTEEEIAAGKEKLAYYREMYIERLNIGGMYRQEELERNKQWHATQKVLYAKHGMDINNLNKIKREKDAEINDRYDETAAQKEADRLSTLSKFHADILDIQGNHKAAESMRVQSWYEEEATKYEGQTEALAALAVLRDEKLKEIAEEQTEAQKEAEKTRAGFEEQYGQMGMSKFDIMREELDKEKELWEEAEISKTEIDELYAEKRKEIAKAEMDQRLNDIQSLTGDMANNFKEIAEMGGKHSKKAFALYKAFKITETVISTYSAAMKAYDALAWIPGVGPALGAAAAATTVVFGMAQVAAIKNSQPPSYDVGGVSEARGVYQTGNIREAHIPLKSGAIPVDLGKGSGGGIAVTNNITVQSTGGDPDADRKQANTVARMVEQKVRQVLVQEKRHGGLLTT